jgi:hypothetical protein
LSGGLAVIGTSSPGRVLLTNAEGPTQLPLTRKIHDNLVIRRPEGRRTGRAAFFEGMNTQTSCPARGGAL